VAATDEDGEPSKITQHGLANRSGVARSTIAKYVAYNASGDGEINPDLETICRLAHALNVPPALLLMRTDDWRRLALAAGTLAQALSDPKVLEFSKSVIDDQRSNAVSHAKTGLKIGERLGVCPSVSASESTGPLDQQTVQMKQGIRRGALVTSALPPGSLLRSQYCAPLLSLCASLGATTNID
jgi:transcriptional regulator with XRE-family HTH domain